MKEAQDPADRLEEIATQLGSIGERLSEDLESFSFELELNDLVLLLDDVADDLRREALHKTKDLCGYSISYCLFCGEQFACGTHHHCDKLVTRGMAKAQRLVST